MACSRNVEEIQRVGDDFGRIPTFGWPTTGPWSPPVFSLYGFRNSSDNLHYKPGGHLSKMINTLIHIWDTEFKNVIAESF